MQLKPNFDSMLAIWSKIEAAIEGRPSIASPTYLRQYETESDKKYRYRSDFTSYHGLPAAIQDAKIAVFGRGTVSLAVPPVMDTIKADVDMQGANAKKFREQLFAEADTYGVMWVRIDEPTTDTKPESEADRKAMGLRPYACIVSPRWIVNWTTDKFGKLLTLTQDLDERIEVEKKEYAVYRLFDKDTIKDVYYTTDKDGNEVDVEVKGRTYTNTQIDAQGHLCLPWVLGGMKKSRTQPGYYVSPSAALSDVAVELFVRMSQKAYYFAKVAFSMLVGPKSPAVTSAGDSKYMGITNDDPTPFWLTPPADLFAAFRDDITLLIDQIFVVARKKGMAVATGSAQAKSGAALAIEASEEESVVGAIAAAVHDVERRMWEMLAVRMSQDFKTIQLVYPETWDVKTYQEELDHLSGVAKLRNRDLYLWECENFARRKVSNLEQQSSIIDAFKSALNIRLEDVNVQTLDTLVSLGLVSLADVARDVNPKYDTKTTDADIMADVEKNAAEVAGVKDELGTNIPVRETSTEVTE